LKNLNFYWSHWSRIGCDRSRNAKLTNYKIGVRFLHHPQGANCGVSRDQIDVTCLGWALFSDVTVYHVTVYHCSSRALPNAFDWGQTYITRTNPWAWWRMQQMNNCCAVNLLSDCVCTYWNSPVAILSTMKHRPAAYCLFANFACTRSRVWLLYQISFWHAQQVLHWVDLTANL